MNRACTLDIETNDLLANMLDYSSLPYKLNKEAKLHCIVITDVRTLQSVLLVGSEITPESVKEALEPYDIIIAHNGLKFDFVSLFLFNVFDYKIGELGEKDLLFGREVRFLDSLVISRILNPDRLGGHGAEAWGKRLGELKTDFRGESIKQGLIPSDAPASAEFKIYSPLMGQYCIQDTVVNAKMYLELLEELGDFSVWKLALQQEHKLADRAIRRETFGFDFDKEYALRNLDFLIPRMQELSDNVTPRLPKKPFNQGELSDFTPPKNQVKADGELTVHFKNFLKRHNMDYDKEMACVTYKGDWLSLPLTDPLETEREATIDDLDVVKAYLIELGWKPTDWKERDLTKDSKKQNISSDKRIKALEKYVQETLGGKYKDERLELLGCTEQNLETTLKRNILGQRAVKVFTTPNVRVGVTKELCPNLIKLGDKVDFVKDFVEYLTYKHRKSSIAGGDIEDMDFDNEVPQSGYLYQVREQDGRIATPAIEIGASTNRYKHIGVANVPRASSLFGEEMRSMFGAGKDYIQFGFDYASLEARIEGHYIYPYEGGADMAVSLLAEKPNDIHSLTALKLNIPRDDAKSVNYAILYGASANKFVKMLGYTQSKAKQFVIDWWDMNLALKQLKEDKEAEWIASGKKYITSIDGRRINIRSQHSILNALFQSAGVICAKYVLIKMFEKFDKLGYKTDCFRDVPDIAEMISYHDEAQLAVKPSAIKFKTFDTKDEAKEFMTNWHADILGQLGAIQEGKDGKFFITLPSDVSRVITESVQEVEEMFGMQVNLGYEYVCGRNWYQCH